MVELPISSATGGLLRGVDPVKLLNGCEEAEDVERFGCPSPRAAE